MSDEIVSTTILFADVTDSTNLYDSQNVMEAKAVMDRAIGHLLEEVEAHGGQLVKTIGDEIMCAFDNTEAAARAAMAMQSHAASNPREPRIKIGLQWGEVVERAGDYFGDAVNVAARLVSLSKPDAILTTREVYDQVSGELREKFHLLRYESVKGKASKQEIYEIAVQPATVDLQSRRRGAAARFHQVRLQWNGIDYALQAGDMPFTIGAASSNKLLIPVDIVSRQHARVEYRAEQFIFIDDSRNGSWLAFDGKAAFEVEPRSVVTLRGPGVFWFGAPPEDAASIRVPFVCE